MLEPVTKRFSKYTITDSFTFADEIRKMPAENTYMVSFDVKSLFTNVPLAETIDICTKALYEDDTNLKLRKASFIRLMNLATSAIEFSFDGHMYRQIDGVAMGSPLGPTLANIIMGYLEEQYFLNNQKPLMYVRYVDDCFIVFRNKQECDEMFEAFNNLHQSIKFTQEAEINNSLPFLDVRVTRNDDKFLTSVFRKNTFTGQYINFQSYCTKRRKVNLIRTLCDRAMKLCSATYLDDEIKTIVTLMQDNGFPENLVQRTIQQRLQTKATKSDPMFGPDLHTIAIKLPFLGSKSHQIDKNLNKMVKECYNSARPRVIFTSRSNFTPATKDHIPLFNQSKVIYRFQCHCGNDYVGKTSRRLVDRVKEHVPTCVRRFLADPHDQRAADTPLVNASKRSSIAKHLLDKFATCGSRYSDDQFRILRRCRTDFQLSVSEAVLILTLQPTLCVQQKFDFITSLI